MDGDGVGVWEVMIIVISMQSMHDTVGLIAT